ncbi:MAG: immunoglobulin domain-containing protein [Vicinamibacterales bacterium]
MSRFSRALFVSALLAVSASAADAATASWNANPEPDIAGYILSYRAATPGVCVGGVPAGTATSLNVGNVTSVMLALTPGVQYFFVVRASNTSGLTSPCSTEVAFTVDSGAPTFTTQPTSQTIAAGQNAAFAVAASGTPAPTYQWQLSTNSGTTWTNLTNTLPYSGVTTATLTITAATGGLNGVRYRAVASSSAGNTPSTMATLTVNASVAPAITAHPTSQTIVAGSNASFTVAASGTPTPTYQWQLSTNGGASWTNLTNTAPYNGVTTATLTVTSATASLTGVQYRAVATNSGGSATSLAATLTVNVAPAITTQPVSQTVAAGSNTAFTVAASGTPTPTYQWQISTNAGTTWTNLTNTATYSGVTTVSLTVASVTVSLTGAQYRAVATSSAGTATSTAATLTVNAAPAITTQPTSQTVTAGANTSFTVAASGSPAPTYQWQLSTDGGASWTNLTNAAPYSGVTTATLTVTSATAGLTGAQYRAVATNSGGTATSNAATLTVNVAPAITTQPTSQTVAAGSNTSFTVAASGTPTPTYQWQISTNGGTSWTNLTNTATYSGVTTTTLTVTNVTAGLSGAQYRAVATNSAGTATSTAATLTVNTAPAITTQPTNQTVAAGSNTSFTVAASGSPTPTYQWQVSTDSGASWTNLTNAAPYSGVTTITLTVTSVTGSLTGTQYRAVATNSGGTATSNAATLTVNVAPAITTQPTNQTVAAGSSTSFMVAASGTPTPTYQWQISTNGGTTWTNLTNTATYSGVTTVALTVANATAGLSGAQYRAVATNSAGTATSAAATLTVNTAPAITTQPTNQTVSAGSNTSFTVAASGAPAPTYQWQLSADSGASWTNLTNAAPYSGVTTTTLTVTSVTASLAGAQYRAVATNSVGSATSSAGTLTVNVTPAITAQPTNQTVATGSTAAFTAAATGTPTPTYQWQVSTNGGVSFSNVSNGAPYSGVTTPTITITNVTAALGGNQYRAVATNSVGSATSIAATLTLNDSAPVFTTQPTNQTVTAGQNASFTVTANGTPAPTYQWQLSTNGGASWTNLTNTAPYSGVATATLAVTSPPASLTGAQYRAVATNTAGTATSAAATLTVNAAPAITTQPASQTVASGANGSFTVGASGTPAPTYQWQLSTDSGVSWANLTNTAPYSGVTTATLTATSVTTSLTGAQYRAVATNSVGSVTSNAATLTVTAAPVITTQPTNQTVTVGANASFTVAASGTPTPTYQWQLSTNGGVSWTNLTNAAPYGGVTTATLTVTNATAGLSGAQYRAVATNSAGTATSTAATLAVTTAPAITTQPTNQTLTAGQTASFTVAASGTPAPTYQWQLSTDSGVSWTNLTNTAPYSGVTTATLTATSVTTSLTGAQYRAVATNSVGSATSNAATLTVNSAPATPVITTQPANQTVTAGANASFTVAASGTPTPTYQWQVSTDSGVSWTNLTNAGPYSGAATATLAVTSATASLTGSQYRAVATNTAGTATSAAATLTVNTAPTITTQPANQTVTEGQTASFTVAASGAPAPTYQWQVSTNGGVSWTNLTNTAPYSGATTATLTVTSVATGLNGAQYRAVATNGAGSATSNAASLTVNVATVPPAITAQPANQTVTAGQIVSFAVAANGIPAPAFQWQLSTNGGTTWSNLTNTAPYGGVTTTTLTLAGATAAMSGNQYRALATNSAGTAISAAATLTVNTAPAITTQPVNQTVTAGANASFTTAASGTPAATYQWQLSTDSGASWTNLANAAPYSGVTTATVALTSVAASLTGAQYRAVATNSAGSATSSAATLTVNTPPALTAQPVDRMISPGQNTSFAVSASGAPSPTYQWQISINGGTSFANLANGAPYSGVTTATLTLTNVPAGLTGAQYRAVVSNSAGTATSNAATLTVVVAPAITTQPANQTTVSGQNASLTVVASGIPAPTYQWQASIDGVVWTNLVSASATTATLTLTATDWWNQKQFRCVATNAGGSATSAAATLTVYGTMTVSPTAVTFSATKAAASATLSNLTPAQSTMTVGFTAQPTGWTATANRTWLQVTNGTGAGAGQFTVQIVNPGNVIGASTVLSGAITVTATASDNWPVEIPITLLITQTLGAAPDAGPFGSFDAPASGTTGVQGAVALSGWALSDTGIDRVEIWRDVVPGETTPPYDGSGPGRGKIFVRTAPLIDGARPDIEAQFAGNAQAARAGWGAQVMTRGLSSRGDGAYTFYAIAYDTSGRSTMLGTTTFSVDNAHATQPFGDLDAPTDGATVSGVIEVTGWALTPGAGCSIAGGSVWMGADARPLVPVLYGQPRADIATAFPGFTNSGLAGGTATLDTTTLGDGTHQISWSMTDTCGRQTWIGSRLITVRNVGATLASLSSAARVAPPSLSLASVNPDPIAVQVGAEARRLASPNAAGVRIVQARPGDHIGVQLPAISGAAYSGLQVVNGAWRALPLGSTLETETGRFAWEPAAGFLGSYELMFIATTGDGASQTVRVRVVVGPSVRLQIDRRAPAVEAAQPFALTGWAIDLAAREGTGVSAVQVWATPVDGGAPLRLATAATVESRPEVAAIYGSQFAAAGFRTLINQLPGGAYDVRISINIAGSSVPLSSGAIRMTVR